MTVPRASGLPSSLVVNACKSSSPVLSDRVSWFLPGAGIGPARAALLRAFSHAETFATNPSGLEER